jgi:hypothetical protein
MQLAGSAQQRTCDNYNIANLSTFEQIGNALKGWMSIEYLLSLLLRKLRGSRHFVSHGEQLTAARV